MSVVRFRNVNPLYHTLMTDFFGDRRMPANRENSTFVPAVNIMEHEGNWEIALAAPGFEKEQFYVNQKANLLTIGANVPTQASDEGKPENTSKLVRKEFESHSFERSFTLPETVETEGINAQYINGILHVSVPKKEVAKPELRKIEIA